MGLAHRPDNSSFRRSSSRLVSANFGPSACTRSGKLFLRSSAVSKRKALLAPQFALPAFAAYFQSWHRDGHLMSDATKEKRQTSIPDRSGPQVRRRPTRPPGSLATTRRSSRARRRAPRNRSTGPANSQFLKIENGRTDTVHIEIFLRNPAWLSTIDSAARTDRSPSDPWMKVQ
jgi:hypothetical protein